MVTGKPEPARGAPRNYSPGEDTNEFLVVPDEPIFRTTDSEENALELWYREHVMPLRYEHEDPTFMEFDCS